MPPFVRGHRMGNPSRFRIAYQHFPDPSIGVLVLAGRLEEINSPDLSHALHMQGEQLAERKRKGNLTVLVSLALRYADLAALDIDLVEANRHQLAHANP